MKNVPAWAEQMILTVAAEHRRRAPDVEWIQVRTHTRTAGNASVERADIVLTDQKARRVQVRIDGGGCKKRGRMEKQYARLVLLHELAHWLRPQSEIHSREFWVQAFVLYRRFRVPMAYALRSEAEYKQGALDGYWASRDKRGRRPVSHVQITTRVHAGPRE